MTDDHSRESMRAPSAAGEDAARAEADAWIVRLHGDDVGEDDWLRFEAWLSASPGNRRLYDEAQALWSELGERSVEISAMLDQQAAVVAAPRAAMGRRGFALPLAMAAAVALLGGVVAVFQSQRDPAPLTFQTARGETRTIRLDDGSVIALNSGSRIEVVMGRRSRRVTMDDAEASFDVAKDPSRPFLIAVGDQQVRVVGTEFNVAHHRGEVAVTVRRGVVEVRPSAALEGPAAARLTPGAQLVHRPGAAGYDIRRVDPAVAFSWKSGYLVFDKRPLAEVAGDLERYVSVPIEVDPSAARLPFTGVLQIDGEDRMLARIQAALPITMVRSKRGYRLSLRS